jgi:lipoprotein-anchoring transpeptidase ErfK/SrfK
MTCATSLLLRVQVNLKRLVFFVIGVWPGILWRLGPRRRPPFRADELQSESVIAIWCSSRRLYLYRHGVMERSYRIGVGGWRARTPRGQFRIERKIVDPAWSVPDVPVRYGKLSGTTLPAGPGNRLGPRWLGVHGAIGIHGGPCGPLGIGSTSGCVKLSNNDLIELFDRVSVGDPVIIA